MCGISGIFNYNLNKPVSKNDLYLSTKNMANRGPDYESFWFSSDNLLGFGHRRLSIIDLSENANQPMQDDCKNCIVFNGEIYNYKELKKSLIDLGYYFKTNSDTEVILKLYQEYGINFTKKLRGMFAIAIWDQKIQTLFLFRDHFGIKPLYYLDNGKTIMFASQVKSLLNYSEINKIVNPKSYVNFLIWGHIPEPDTFYKNIYSIQPGTGLSVELKGNLNKFEFFSLIQTIENDTDKLDTKDCLDFLNLQLNDSIDKHLTADVPVCSFLSSGVDSNFLTSKVKNNYIKTSNINELNINNFSGITLGFDEYNNTPNDEVPFAKKSAQHLKINHIYEYINYTQFNDHYEKILKYMDQPTIDGINNYFINYIAKKNNYKVALSGIGADEIFSGYKDFKQIPLILNISKIFNSNFVLKNFFNIIAPKLLNSNNLIKKQNVLKYGSNIFSAYQLNRSLFLPEEITKFTDNNFVKQGLEEIVSFDEMLSSNLQKLDLKTLIIYLHVENYLKNQLLKDADWSSMAHSVELRVPFVDIEVFKSILILIKNNFHPTKKHLIDIINNRNLGFLSNRNKTGFNVPINNWISKKNQFISYDAHPTKKWALSLLDKFI